MFLLYPPAAKPGEPPAGIAGLSGALRQHGIASQMADLGLEGMLYLLHHCPEPDAQDRWTRRAWKNREANLRALRSGDAYKNGSRYRKAVLEIGRLLAMVGDDRVRVSLADYQDRRLSPTVSADLLRMAEEPETSVYYPFFRSRLIDLLERYASRYIGISINYLSQALSGFALIGLVRQLAPGVTVVAGGGLITSWMCSSRWSEPFSGLIDHCIAGPGEGPLLELFGCDGGHDTEATGPDFSDLPRNDYLSPGFVLPYSCSSGCYWNRCSFCPERAEGSRFLMKSPARVREEIGGLVTRYRPTLLHLLDNAVPPAVLASFSADHPGVPWYGFARISEQLADLDFCRSLRASGCVMLKLGLESGSQQVLDRLDKGIDLQIGARVLANLREVGIATYVYLLFGTPAEDERDARQTLRFVCEYHRAITYLNLAIFNMPLDSPEAREVETEPFSGDDLALYTGFRHPRGWDRRRVRRFLDREFRRQPQIAAIIRRDPPQFTSNHAPLLVMNGLDGA
ncbi:MAG: radical SAM protein [Desulfofustis sp.]|nr:radical SAM protein [Desulfofustis sp.]